MSITWADGSKERHSLTSKPVAGGRPIGAIATACASRILPLRAGG